MLSCLLYIEVWAKKKEPSSPWMRYIMWAILTPNSKKKIAPDDIVKFSWEQPKSSGEVTTKEQFESIAKQFNLKTI